ncbi:hypothetical protein LEN26_006175 [Aphanomyces euteiches]|nr:hypothetical protein AeMF1_013062 [Aphanomyces euteiches]KAH9136442.1 hypothetical protein LEN26_006175 [Aphanomyces euteiches]KAH9196038.1 hypothetical protein AeNC1_001974 [Aphanomyces euteiches]
MATIANLTTTVPPVNNAAPSPGFDNTSYQWLQILYCITYGAMCMLSLALIVYLRHHRSTAYRGDTSAALKIVLPAFESLFWLTAIVTGVYTLFFILSSILGWAPFDKKWFSELLPQGRQFIYFLITILFLQRSLTRHALVRTFIFALLLAVFPVVLTVLMDETEWSEYAKFTILNIVRAVYVAWYAWLFIRPVSRASPRTQREFYAYVIIYFATVYAYRTLFFYYDGDLGTAFVFVSAIYGSIAPLFIWRLLRADTEHWRGFSDRAIEIQQHFREAQGMQEIVSSQGLHVLLEMHRKDLIDFAHLQFDKMIGIGASAHVFRGHLHSSTQVAIKAYSPTEISQATIANFSKEAALCAVLKHPNIVLFYGMCICPPSICLVYELCRGSLDEALTNFRADYTEPNWPKLCYMLDAARAVAYLHSFTPPFIHRDIKPENFLLDATNRVKLTDFGESRSMAGKMVEIEAKERTMTVLGTPDYMAPEVIDGKAGMAVYTETADIYSLAITLWDILHPSGDKYPTSKRNHLSVFRMVLDGQRPPIDPEVPQTLHDLLENAWNADPIFRPSAKMVVAVLEDLHEDLCGQITYRLSGSMAYLADNKKQAKNVRYFSGEDLVGCLIEHKYAFEVEEAIRLGNALMDAGCLHHTKHNLQFEGSATSTYTFDMHQLDMNKPMADSKVLNTNAELIDDSTAYAGTSLLGDNVGLCGCRKLGQGHVKPKLPRKKLFQRRKDDHHMLTVNLLQQNNEFGEFGTASTITSTPIMLTLDDLA